MQSSPKGIDVSDQATKLAFERTWLAEERTAMAWIRTATSLITFGFAIYSFFVIPSGAGHALTKRQQGATIFALMLIVIGLVALVSGVVQRRSAAKSMQMVYSETPPRSLAALVGSLVAILGITALVLLLSGY